MREYQVFLCHSGRQKDFTEQLCEDLKRKEIIVFFDKESLLEGEEYPKELIQAASTCKVIVAVLSEDFFTASSWPMAEIIASVQGKTPKLLPLFYSISPETTKDATKQAAWCSKWESWGMERHNMDVEQWKNALKAIGITKGVVKGHLSEVDYRSKIVSCINGILSRTEPELGSDADSSSRGGSSDGGSSRGGSSYGGSYLTIRVRVYQPGMNSDDAQRLNRNLSLEVEAISSTSHWMQMRRLTD